MEKTREETASSPSSVHIGHYKACAISEDITKIQVQLINLPFIHGTTLSRWKESIHHMMEKIPGFFLLKMRLIQLIEADFNFYQKLLLLLHHVLF